MRSAPEATLSIVSHGQGALIAQLLGDIRRGVDVEFELIITLNIPEDESFLAALGDLNAIVIRNIRPKGFGANHNAAFARSEGRHFVVMNPDLRVLPVRIRPLIDTLIQFGAGACGPQIRSPEGGVEDSARRFPTGRRILRRKLRRQTGPDYAFADGQAHAVDWIAGMFVVYPRAAYGAVGGFDEDYFMYVEDTDICWRLGLRGLASVVQPAVVAIHEARRASRRSPRYFVWHIGSLLRFFRKRLVHRITTTMTPRRHNSDAS